METGTLSKGEEPIQLISHGLWPASWKKPMTVFTLGALRSHHLLSLQAQISVQDYMTYLTRMTDNVSPENVPVSCSLVRRCSLTHTRAVIQDDVIGSISWDPFRHPIRGGSNRNG